MTLKFQDCHSFVKFLLLPTIKIYAQWLKLLMCSYLVLLNRLKETLDRLAAKLEAIYNVSGGKKINIISHSMGGLLVKCFMSLHSDVSVLQIGFESGIVLCFLLCCPLPLQCLCNMYLFLCAIQILFYIMSLLSYCFTGF